MNLYPFGRAATFPLVHALFRIKYEGLEHIPPGGGYILACNHRSNFDPLLISHKIRTQISYLAKEELTKIPAAGLIVASLGIIPIKRGKGDSSALERAVEVIQKGHILGIFPEGRRAKDGIPIRPRSGVAIIAGQTGADILPVAVTYKNGVRAGSPVTVRYGPMIPNSEVAPKPDCTASVRDASRLIMDKIIELMDVD